MRKVLKNAILDVLTPFSVHGASFVEISVITDRLKKLDLGLEVNDALVRDQIDPNKIAIVTGVDDSKVYLNGQTGDTDEDESMEGPAPEPIDPVNDMAKKQASKNAGD